MIFPDVHFMRFLSKTTGIGGSFGDSQDSFFVQEILPDGTVLPLSGKFAPSKSMLLESKAHGLQKSVFCSFVFRKKNWTTAAAIREISDKMHMSVKRFNTAGNKDRNATTVQVASCLHATPDQFLSINFKDIEIIGAWESAKRVEMGEILGNRFRIKHIPSPSESGASGMRKSDIPAKSQPKLSNAQKKRIVSKIHKETGGYFLNYFGAQRFGSLRKNTYQVGLKILQEDYKGAVESYLFETSDTEPESYRKARLEIAGGLDFKKALPTFPHHLAIERAMMSRLVEKPGDYIGALRTLQRGTLLLFVHAVQSHIFNSVLDLRFDANDFKPHLESNDRYCLAKNGFFMSDIFAPVPDKKSGGRNVAFRLIGYESEKPNEYESEILESLSIKLSDFKAKSMPELSCKGGFRSAFAHCAGFKFGTRCDLPGLNGRSTPANEKDEMVASCDGEWFEFSLQSGSYATVALQEYLKEEKG